MTADIRDLAILLIGGEPSQIATAHETLRELGCAKVVSASNWIEATGAIPETLPDLFIVDVGQHCDSAITAVERLRFRYRVPALFIIERGDAVAIRRIHKMTGVATLARPYDCTCLAVTIAQALKLMPAPPR